MGSWRGLGRAVVSAAASPAHHCEGRLRSAINLSDGWNAPRRKYGGTIDSMASSFSVGSPRVYISVVVRVACPNHSDTLRMSCVACRMIIAHVCLSTWGDMRFLLRPGYAKAAV